MTINNVKKGKKNPNKKDDQVVADREEVRGPESSGERRRLKKVGTGGRLFLFLLVLDMCAIREADMREKCSFF